jgi:hypothetical protein
MYRQIKKYDNVSIGSMPPLQMAAIFQLFHTLYNEGKHDAI